MSGASPITPQNLSIFISKRGGLGSNPVSDALFWGYQMIHFNLYYQDITWKCLKNWHKIFTFFLVKCIHKINRKNSSSNLCCRHGFQLHGHSRFSWNLWHFRTCPTLVWACHVKKPSFVLLLCFLLPSTASVTSRFLVFLRPSPNTEVCTGLSLPAVLSRNQQWFSLAFARQGILGLLTDASLFSNHHRLSRPLGSFPPF